MYIQSTIIKGTAKILARPAKFKIGEDEVDKMLLGKELLKWLHYTRKLSANMRQAYTVILGQCKTFTRSKIKIPKGWE